MTQWGLDVLFNPAKRHMDEEKQRLQSTREEAGDASKGNRIDLTSGKVTIRRKPAADAVDAAAGAGAGTTPAEAVAATADEPADDDAATQDDPAEGDAAG